MGNPTDLKKVVHIERNGNNVFAVEIGADDAG
jgi:hypothetical protein